MKIYKAKKKGLIQYLLIGILVLPIIILLLDHDIFMAQPVIVLPLLAPMLLLLWIYFFTHYKIENERLHYRSGFISGNIEISTISEITKGKTLWSGIKPALASKGLIIRFNHHNEVYLAPENNDEMIFDLLKINKQILVHE